MSRSGSRVMALWTRVMLDEISPAWRSAGWLEDRGIVEAAALRGAAPMIPHEDMIRIWAQLTDGHPDPWFGIRFAERHAPRAVGLLTYAGAHALDLRAATASLLRMQRLADTHNQVTLVEAGDEARLGGAPSPKVGHWPRHLAESILAGYLVVARVFTGHAIRVREVAFQHTGDPSIAQWFGGAVRFSAQDNELVLKQSELSRPLLAADPVLFDALEAAGARYIAAIAPAGGAIGDVLKALRSLPVERRTVGDVADALAWSTRTLQRKLTAEGTTFRRLVEEARTVELAEQAATDVTAKDASMAGSLGYRSASSVRRLRQRRSRRR